jgi:hypothetical protein
MNINFFLVDPNKISVRDGYHEKKDGFIYEHLKYYCSFFESLPAVTAVVEDNRLWVSRGLLYLQIAKELARTSIRVAVINSKDGISFDGMQRRIEREELESEMNDSIVEAWHVFFLQRKISDQDRAEICKYFDDFLDKSFIDIPWVGSKKIKEWKNNQEMTAIALRFQTPVENYEWASKFRRALEFLPNELKVISYQGRELTRNP